MNSNLAVFLVTITKGFLLPFFWINDDGTLSDLNDQLDQLNPHLNHRDTRKMVSVEYHCLSIFDDGCVCFTNMQL